MSTYKCVYFYWSDNCRDLLHESLILDFLSHRLPVNASWRAIASKWFVYLQMYLCIFSTTNSLGGEIMLKRQLPYLERAYRAWYCQRSGCHLMLVWRFIPSNWSAGSFSSYKRSLGRYRTAKYKPKPFVPGIRYSHMRGRSLLVLRGGHLDHASWLGVLVRDFDRRFWSEVSRYVAVRYRGERWSNFTAGDGSLPSWVL